MDSSSKFHCSNTLTPMGEAVSNSTTSRSREMESLSLEISEYPRDLLQLATNQSSSSSSTTRRLGEPQIIGEGDGDEDDDGLNLGLGLSLGGKFGVEKSHMGLKRSSSIIGTMPLIREDVKVASSPPAAVHTLARTASLPLETGEEWKKRKEMQTLRRMEAKRRRFEKQRILKEGGNGGEEKGIESVNFRGRLEKEQQNLGITNKFGGSSMGNPFGSSSSSKVEVKGRRTTFGSLQGFLMAQTQVQAQAQQGGSQGSGESQGGSCSGASELESITHQGLSSCGEARSPGSIHSAQERGSQESMGSSRTKLESTQRPSAPEADSPSKQPDQKRREMGGGGGGMEDMPCVFTIGDGPQGRKVEGILYRYGKGEEVRIMCVCHGSFFSPAEFVRHAGGRDVDHPLRHIVVSPSPSAFQ